MSQANLFGGGEAGLEQRQGTRAPRGDARDLATQPCASCGAAVIWAHDATAGGEIALDPAAAVYLEVGVRTDGTHLFARAANGLAQHRCTPSPLEGHAS